MVISRFRLLGMRNLSDKICREKIKTHFEVIKLLFVNRALCELM